VTELAFDGDADALALLADLGAWLGIGLVNVVNIFNPDVVVIGGGVIAAGELILAPPDECWQSARLLCPRNTRGPRRILRRRIRDARRCGIRRDRLHERSERDGWNKTGQRTPLGAI